MDARGGPARRTAFPAVSESVEGRYPGSRSAGRWLVAQLEVSPSRAVRRSGCRCAAPAVKPSWSA